MPMATDDLRHAAASLMLAQGVSMRAVMETLGHSTIGVTMNTYAHVLPELQRHAAEQQATMASSTAAPPTTCACMICCCIVVYA